MSGWATWTDYTRALPASAWWRSAEAERVFDKRAGKAWAREMGLRTAELLGPDRPCVTKPARGHSCRGASLWRNPMDLMVEELTVDVDGSVPPRDFRLYCFNGEAIFVEVCRHDLSRPDGGLHDVRYYWLHDLSIADVDAEHRPTGRPVGAARGEIAEMASAAERVAARFGVPFLRVDFHLSDRGLLFSELCATPGLVVGKWIWPHWDAHFGEMLKC